jgi:D-xylose transport system permease protein
LIIVSGQIDLSVGSVVGFLGAMVAVLNTNKGYSAEATMAVVLLTGMLIGLVQGALASYQAIPAFIVTLGGMMAFRGASMWVTANSTVPLQDNWLKSIGTAYVGAGWGWVIVVSALVLMITVRIRNHLAEKKHGLETVSAFTLGFQLIAVAAGVLGFMKILSKYEGIPVPVLLLAALTVIVHFISVGTRWGRHVYAIGGNREAAFLSGINDKFKILTVFILMGFLTAVGGVILTARVGSASPDAGQLLELDAIASCVIGGTSLMGGKGSIPGAILGALVMESLNNGMSMANIEPFWQYIVKGLVLVVAVWADIASQKNSR